MKRTFLIGALTLLGLGIMLAWGSAPGETAYAAEKPYRVVFDLTSRDSLDQKAVMRWIREISASNPKVEMEVVMYGKGFELVMPDRTTMLSDVQGAAKSPNVKFKVCEIAMKNNKIEKSQLIPEVQTVPDGIHEIVMRQQDGWGYIKVGH
jgi:intracellular sulfur oxidation DsrE/DsrF family protein